MCPVRELEEGHSYVQWVARWTVWLRLSLGRLVGNKEVKRKWCWKRRGLQVIIRMGAFTVRDWQPLESFQGRAIELNLCLRRAMTYCLLCWDYVWLGISNCGGSEAIEKWSIEFSSCITQGRGTWFPDRLNLSCERNGGNKDVSRASNLTTEGQICSQLKGWRMCKFRSSGQEFHLEDLWLLYLLDSYGGKDQAIAYTLQQQLLFPEVYICVGK
jgi:hypothetical protein